MIGLRLVNDKPEDPTVGAQYIINGRTMAVIHVDEELVTLRDWDRPHTLSLTIDALITEVAQKTIVQFSRPPGAGSKALAYLDPEDPQVIAAEYKFCYVDAAYKQFGGSLPKEATNALIAQLSNERGDSSAPCYNSLYKWLRKYKEHNCDRFCLLKEQSFARRGKRLDPEVESLIQEMIKEEYQKTPPARIQTIHRFIHAQIILINRRREGYSTFFLKPPSLSTIQRKIRKLCHATSDKARQGKGYVKKYHHSSKLSDEPLELLDLAEIDNHLIDINIIDENGNLLGKILWWTVILEIKTRSVIGWELSATYPCAEKTIRALKKALQAVPGEEHRRGKPIHLHSDNGSEFVNEVVRNFLDRLNILFDRGPPYTPNARAREERFFKTFELWLHEQAGTTMSNPAERKYYDSEGEAAFTAESMKKHTEYWIENIYHQRKHRTLNMPPAVAWERAMKNRLPPEKFTEEDLDILCRGVENASISEAGRVSFLCLSWYGPNLQEIRSNLKPGQRAKCFYNPLDLGTVWVAHPDNPRHPAPANAAHPEYQNGLTLTEHNLVHQQFLAEGREFDDSEADLALFLLRQRMNEEYESSRHLHPLAKSKHTASPNVPTPDNMTTARTGEVPSGDDDIPVFEVEKL